ncbi:hypothetical protein ACEPAF_8164 [Sanghuangporus sanghuang]
MSSTVSTDDTLQSDSSTSIKATKRKIDDALYNLDQALRSTDDVQRPPPKKMKFPGSLYSTLAKYGIKTKSKLTPSAKPGDLSFLSKTAPHLSAIVSRAAVNKEREAEREKLTRSAVTSANAQALQPAPVEYRPSSTASFLSRLATFKLSTYSSKPSTIDAVVAAKAGWINEGKERLLCGVCKAAWVLASRDGLSKDAANALIEKQRVQLVQMHKEGCPWRARQCDDSVYCIPLKAPSAHSKEIKSNALALDDKKALDGVDIRHPLTSTQVRALLSTLSSVKVFRPSTTVSEESSTDNQATQEETTETEISEKAVLTALFGWSLEPPPTESRPTMPSNVSGTSISCAPALSGADRRTSWSSSISEAGSPRPSRIPVPRTSSAATARLCRQDKTRKRDDTLHCSLCQRRVGLWTFKGSDDTASLASPIPSSPASTTKTTSRPSAASISTSGPITNGPSRLPTRRISQGPIPKRQFDLLKEHRSYCPYVVRSTAVPSLSSLVNPGSTARSFSASYAIAGPRPTPSHNNPTSSFNFSSLRGNSHHPEPEATGGLGDPTAVEGWRAVVAMVMRTDLGRRQRQRNLMNTQVRRSSSDTAVSASEQGADNLSAKAVSTGDDPMEIEDGIEKMVEEVKKHGGKDLLRYVKKLFR